MLVSASQRLGMYTMALAVFAAMLRVLQFAGAIPNWLCLEQTAFERLARATSPGHMAVVHARLLAGQLSQVLASRKQLELSRSLARRLTEPKAKQQSPKQECFLLPCRRHLP